MADRDTQSTAEDLLPIGEAARILHVSIETVRRWNTSGDLVSTRTPGGQRRFLRSEVERVRDQMIAEATA